MLRAYVPLITKMDVFLESSSEVLPQCCRVVNVGH